MKIIAVSPRTTICILHRSTSTPLITSFDDPLLPCFQYEHASERNDSQMLQELNADVLMKQQLNYISITCFTIVIWDWIICFEDERRYIWARKKTGASYYYMFFRIYSVAFTLWNNVVENMFVSNLLICSACMMINSLVDVVLIFVMSTMFQGRVYAMYDRSKKVLWFNIGVWLAYLFVILVIYTLNGPKIKSMPRPYPLKGCAASVPDQLWIPWIPSIYLEFVVCLEVIYKTVLQLKGGDYASQGSLYALLVRDYAVWFMSGSFLTVANLLISRLASYLYKNVGIPFFHCIVCTTASHLILNLKEAYFHDNEKTEQITIDTFQFTAGASGTTGTGRGFGFGTRGDIATAGDLTTDGRPETSFSHPRNPGAAAGDGVPQDSKCLSRSKHSQHDVEKALMASGV